MADSYESQPRAKSSFHIRAKHQMGLTVQVMLAIYVGTYALQWVLNSVNQVQLDKHVALSLSTLSSQPWSLATFFLFHATADPFHFLIVMAALVFVSPELERKLGAKLFLCLLGAGAMGGGLVHLGLTMAMGHSHLSVVGSAGAAYGLLWAYFCFFPESRFLGLPRGKWLAPLLALMIFVSGWRWELGSPGFEYRPQIAGGFAAAGFLLLVPRFRHMQARLETRRKIQGIVSDSEMMAEVDDLLHKISREGMEALSRTEKKVLQRASHRYRRIVDREPPEPDEDEDGTEDLA